MRLAGIVPWAHIEEIYIHNLSDETGRPALSSRIAFGAILIRAYDHLADEKTVENIQENHYQGLAKLHANSSLPQKRSRRYPFDKASTKCKPWNFQNLYF